MDQGRRQEAGGIVKKGTDGRLLRETVSVFV